MESKPRRIRHYLTKDDKDPFERWIQTLDHRARSKVLVRLDRAEDGNLGDHASVGNDVWEMRIFFGPGYRLYYGEDGNDIILLTGGTKATQAKDIEKAKEYWRDYNA